MRLYRFRLRPLSPWITPWQADTFAGLLSWTCARTQGNETLLGEILRPANDGAPRFVFSDAFPGDLLPIPLSLKGKAWPPDERKRVKKARWLTRDAFRRFQVGGKLTLDDLIDIPGVTTVERLHNSIDRATNTTGSAGSLFSQLEMFLEGRTGATPSLDFLTLYARVTEGFEEQLMTLLTDLAKTGFGADLSVGCGEFELLSGLEAADDMGATNSPSNGVVVLSTFQPGSNDPVEGVWDAFTKYGKLGPDFGIDNVFKRPMVCLRPGACFRTERTSEFLGRAIKMDELLAPDVCRVLRERGSEVMHLAYGLSLPATLN